MGRVSRRRVVRLTQRERAREERLSVCAVITAVKSLSQLREESAIACCDAQRSPARLSKCDRQAPIPSQGKLSKASFRPPEKRSTLLELEASHRRRLVDRLHPHSAHTRTMVASLLAPVSLAPAAATRQIRSSGAAPARAARVVAVRASADERQQVSPMGIKNNQKEAEHFRATNISPRILFWRWGGRCCDATPASEERPGCTRDGVDGYWWHGIAWRYQQGGVSRWISRIEYWQRERADCVRVASVGDDYLVRATDSRHQPPPPPFELNRRLRPPPPAARWPSRPSPPSPWPPPSAPPP
jgi:hypothetical protein